MKKFLIDSLIFMLLMFAFMGLINSNDTNTTNDKVSSFDQNLGTADIYMLDDEWTILTDDGKPSAHFEHTVVVTKDGYEILTGVIKNG